MASRQGFSLMEIIVVMVIVGIVAAISLPNLVTSAERSKAQGAENNLYAISAAEQKYNEDYSMYCTTTTDYGSVAPYCDSQADINTDLHLSLADGFTYSCTVAGTVYGCTATDAIVTLTLAISASGAATVTCAPTGANCPL